MRYAHCCVVVCFVNEARYIPCVMHTAVLWFVLLMKHVISHALCTVLCCGLFCLWSTLYPMRYVHGRVVVCFVYEVRYIPCVMYTVVLWFVLFMKHVISHAWCTWLCCGLLGSDCLRYIWWIMRRICHIDKGVSVPVNEHWAFIH